MSAPRGTYTAHAAYAGFWRRFAAMLVDFIVLFIGYFALGVVLAMNNSNDKNAHESLVTFLGFFAQWAYFAGMESSDKGGTLGKILLGIKVVDLSGNKITFGRASGRYFGKIISGLTLGIGYLMAAFTSTKQTLHDKMASCLVVTRDATPESVRQLDAPKAMGGGTLTVLILACTSVPVLGILAAVAIPAYHDYTAKAQASEAYTLLGALRSQFIDTAGSRSTVAASCSISLYPAAEKSGKYVRAVTMFVPGQGYGDGCAFEARFRDTGVHTKLAGRSVRMMYDATTSSWSCGTNIPTSVQSKLCTGSLE